MAAPTLTPAAAYLYRQVAPLADADAENGYALAHLCAALARPFDQLYAVGHEGDPAWSTVMDGDDLDHHPEWATDWLAQFAGVDSTVTSDHDEKHALITEAAGQKRGTRASMIAAVKHHLTGLKRVSFVERDSSAYHFVLHTYTAETPDPAAVEATALKFKPAGLVMEYEVVDGQLVAEVEANFATVGAVEAAYTTVGGVENDQPGT